MLAALILLPWTLSNTFAADVHLAVAANFMAPMENFSTRFSEKTGHKLIISYGATGKLYSQIMNGAPFDVFLSADQEAPKKLIQENQAVNGTQFTYTTGRLALWSADPKRVDSRGEVLAKAEFKHLAIANPKLAPYGVAAQQTLEKLGLWHKFQPRLVLGESITQAYQFIATGNAELGFVALSQIKQEGKKPEGSFWLVPQTMYSPLRQDAVLLEKGKNNVAAKQFLEFLRPSNATP
ncbi:molybdate ABC transporter substrate-binding protein [Bdellovibrionota bacterium FG-1]